MNAASSRNPPRARRGVALIEAVLATIVIGLMMVAALRTIVATRAGQVDSEHRILASHLATELMTEIISQPYLDPDELPTFGPEASEKDASGRSAFDDVDDYHGWMESPPMDRDGAPRAHLDGWERRVEVVWVEPADLPQIIALDRGVKRITVTVTRAGVPLSRLTALRTAAVPR